MMQKIIVTKPLGLPSGGHMAMKYATISLSAAPWENGVPHDQLKRPSPRIFGLSDGKTKCAHPDCDARIGTARQDKVCSRHKHGKFCQCGPCMERRARS